MAQLNVGTCKSNVVHQAVRQGMWRLRSACEQHDRSPRELFRRGFSARLALLSALVALVVPAVTGCESPGGTASTQLPSPTFGTLEVPDLAGGANWVTYSTSNPPAEVLPVRGRAVRVYFYAPIGSDFDVSIRELATGPASSAVTTPLTRNSGAPAPSGAGFFQILNVNPNSNPPTYHMYVRPPASLMTNPANYDILVVNRSQRANATDSSPMVVSLRARKIYTVDVTVMGNGHVTSSPAGIECGLSYSGLPLTKCSADFGPGSITLNPNSNNNPDPNAPPTTRFLGWSGNCPSAVQSCVLSLNGSGRSVANAAFGPPSGSASSAMPTAAVVTGWKWIGIPGCGPIDSLPGVTVQWDAQGFFCCSSRGPSDGASPRCSGLRETAADCRNQPNQGLNARLIQPGGCYEADTFP